MCGGGFPARRKADGPQRGREGAGGCGGRGRAAGGVHSNSSALGFRCFYEPNRSRASYRKLPPPRTSFPCSSSSAVGLAGGSGCQESACKTGNLGSDSWVGRSPGGGNCNPFRYFCLGNPVDRGSWRVTGSRRVGCYLETENKKKHSVDLSCHSHEPHAARERWAGGSSEFRGTTESRGTKNSKVSTFKWETHMGFQRLSIKNRNISL